MGNIWLLSMPEVLRSAGLDVDEYNGWQTRSRASGGYDALHGVELHHTASDTTPENDMGYMWRNAPTAPIGALYIARDAKVTVGAAGATNTSGRGGPMGPIRKDEANRSVISIEAGNNGVGEVWPDEQQEAYLIAVNALVRAYGLDFGVPGVHAHFEWAPGRKIGPAGNSRWAVGGDSWDMDRFRLDASNVNTPDPTPDPIPKDDDMAVRTILIDARNGAVYLCGPESKTWVDSHLAAEQFSFRIMEALGQPVDYTLRYPLPGNVELTPVCPFDGHRYVVRTNGNPDLVASYGPIVGPRPAGVDEYGR